MSIVFSGKNNRFSHGLVNPIQVVHFSKEESSSVHGLCVQGVQWELLQEIDALFLQARETSYQKSITMFP